jgi:hypothetical protein
LLAIGAAEADTVFALDELMKLKNSIKNIIRKRRIAWNGSLQSSLKSVLGWK